MPSDVTDFAWLTEDPSELMRYYGGQWLAVYNGQVIAPGADGLEVYRQARRIEPDADILMEHVQREPVDSLYELVFMA